MNLESLYTGEKTSLYNVCLGTTFLEEGTEPVTLAEFKEYARIDVNDNDTIITLLLKAARQKLETYANISLISRTLKALLNTPNGYYPLPYRNVNGETTITAVKDTEGTTIDYTSNAQGIKVQTSGAYEVTYTIDYGTTPLPSVFKLAIMDQALFMYDNRGDQTIIPPVVQYALKPYMFK